MNRSPAKRTYVVVAYSEDWIEPHHLRFCDSLMVAEDTVGNLMKSGVNFLVKPSIYKLVENKKKVHDEPNF